MEKMNNAVLKKTNSIFDQVIDKITYLYCRWQDEKDYEDFDDYVKEARKSVEKANGNFVKMTKRPFGVTISIGQVRVLISVTSRQLGWKQIA